MKSKKEFIKFVKNMNENSEDCYDFTWKQNFNDLEKLMYDWFGWRKPQDQDFLMYIPDELLYLMLWGIYSGDEEKQTRFHLLIEKEEDYHL